MNTTRYEMWAWIHMKAIGFACIAWLTCVTCVAQGASTAGVGLILGVDGQDIVVRAIVPDSPAAARNTLQAGDKIIAVAQEKEIPVQLHGVKLAEAVSLVRGAAGTTVRLTVVPSGGDDSQAVVVSLVRGELKELSRWGDGKFLESGLKAPDIELVRLPDGGRERLSNHAGKIVVLEFWATWCGPCQPKMAELQHYVDRYSDWKGKVVLIAASVDDDRETASMHLEAKGWKQTHNTWVEIEAIKAFHVGAIPTTYVIDPAGKIVAANPVSIPEIVSGLIKNEHKHVVGSE